MSFFSLDSKFSQIMGRVFDLMMLNIIFLIMIVAAVILSGTLPNLAAFQDAAGNVRGIRVFRLSLIHI